jgi:hypothetical protein
VVKRKLKNKNKNKNNRSYCDEFYTTAFKIKQHRQVKWLNTNQ